MTSHFMLRRALLPLAIAALAGCSLAPTYERPQAPVASHWQAADAEGARAQALDWQTFIVEADLRRAVDTALSNNRSLRQALLDIEAARAQYRIQRADRLPSINANASGNRQRLLCLHRMRVAVKGNRNVSGGVSIIPESLSTHQIVTVISPVIAVPLRVALIRIPPDGPTCVPMSLMA